MISALIRSVSSMRVPKGSHTSTMNCGRVESGKKLCGTSPKAQVATTNIPTTAPVTGQQGLWTVPDALIVRMDGQPVPTDQRQDKAAGSFNSTTPAPMPHKTPQQRSEQTASQPVADLYPPCGDCDRLVTAGACMAINTAVGFVIGWAMAALLIWGVFRIEPPVH